LSNLAKKERNDPFPYLNGLKIKDRIRFQIERKPAVSKIDKLIDFFRKMGFEFDLLVQTPTAFSFSYRPNPFMILLTREGSLRNLCALGVV